MVTKEWLETRHKDELADADMYARYSEECPNFAGLLRDIAEEEREHAETIKYIMEHMQDISK